MNEKEVLVHPVILVDTTFEETVYRVMEAIGSSSLNDGITIYKAEIIKPIDSYPWPWPWVSIMYVDKRDTAAVYNLNSQVSPTDWIQNHVLRSLVTFSHDNYHCVTFSYMNHGSLLSVMARRFPCGLPEQCIPFFLDQALQALFLIHHRKVPHGHISAAQIFVGSRRMFGREKVTAALGYAGLVHHLFEDQVRDSSSPYLPATSICRWAAAPPPTRPLPLFHNDNRIREEYEAKADIWSVGITALELAYGGLRLNTREELESLVKKIHRSNKLPKNLNDDPLKSKRKSKRRRILWPWASAILVAPTGHEYRPKERFFSKRFVNLVRACLHFNPDKRPTADQLCRQSPHQSIFYKRI